MEAAGVEESGEEGVEEGMVEEDWMEGFSCT